MSKEEQVTQLTEHMSKLSGYRSITVLGKMWYKVPINRRA